MPTSPISNVSDTARWVAYYRAMETDRPDAIFRDPFAKQLAGEQGERIVNTMKRGRAMAWPMIVRTKVLDEIIQARVEQGIDMVVNLAAGLDARPWRMPLPYDLRWVDVDLPGILDYKLATIGDAKPNCRYEALRVDLTDHETRAATFARLGSESRKVLVVSEGLLIYLGDDDVAALARDLHAQSSFRWWTFDLAAPLLLQFMKKSWGKAVERGNAPFRFAPEAGTGFFEPFGWRETESHYSMDDAARLDRGMEPKWLWKLMGIITPPKRRKAFHDMSRVVVLERD